MIKVASSYFGTRSKVFKAKNTIIKTFNLVLMYLKSFNLVPQLIKLLIYWKKHFWSSTKINENFRSMVWSSGIGSNDHNSVLFVFRWKVSRCSLGRLARLASRPERWQLSICLQGQKYSHRFGRNKSGVSVQCSRR